MKNRKRKPIDAAKNAIRGTFNTPKSPYLNETHRFGAPNKSGVDLILGGLASIPFNDTPEFLAWLSGFPSKTVRIFPSAPVRKPSSLIFSNVQTAMSLSNRVLLMVKLLQDQRETLVSKVISNLRPRLVVMAGICAGIPGEAELGEVVVADPAWDWQMGKYTKETFEINPDQIGVSPEITEKFKILAQDSHALLALAEKFEGERPPTMPRIKPGPMASGSAVIANETITADVRKQNRKLMAFDMEMYAVYSACRDAASPRPMFFGLKGVCDHADHYKNDKYQKYSSHLSAGAIQLFLERYGADLL